MLIFVTILLTMLFGGFIGFIIGCVLTFKERDVSLRKLRREIIDGMREYLDALESSEDNEDE